MSVRDDLKAFLDGELSPEREQEVRAALDADPQLQAELTELESLSVAFQKVKAPVPHGMESTLLALEAAKRPAPRGWRSGWLFGTGIATAAALALVLILPQMRDARDGSDMVAMRSESATASTYSAPEDAQNAMEAKDTVPTESSKQEGSAPAAAAPAKEQADEESPKMERRSRTGSVPSSPKKPTNQAEPKVEKSSVPTTASPVAGALPPAAVMTETLASESVVTEIVVDSLEEAEALLKEMVAERGGTVLAPPSIEGATQKTRGAEPANHKSLSVNVPEADAEKFLEELKQLPKKLEERKERVARGAGGGPGAVADSANRDTKSAMTQKPKMKTLKIVIRSKPPVETPPKSAG